MKDKARLVCIESVAACTISLVIARGEAGGAGGVGRTVLVDMGWQLLTAVVTKNCFNE